MKEQRFVREIMEAKRRVILISFFVGGVFLLLLLRLWNLQILKADQFRGMSENNRLRFVPIAASRGAIMDRNGMVLVSNRPSFSLAVIPQEVKDREHLLDLLSSLLKLDRTELAERWDKGKGRARYYPVVLASNITRDQVEIVEENRLHLPGVEIEMKPVREYSSGMLAAHLLGYIGEVSEEELNAKGNEEYNPGDYVGKNGIERSWENELHGNDGGRELEVDARGRVLRTISESHPTVGNSVVLTIDAKLQKQAERAFGEQAGAAVAMDVNNGEILAFVSNPAFDPALFSGKLPAATWKSYLEDKRHPLENKALSGQYPPGSTFKMVTALAGLESGLVNESSNITCKGQYELGGSTFRCWNKSGHGSVSLRKSLKESCDVYYYLLGERLGVDKIAAMSRRFGLGEAMGVELLHEKKGLVPSTDWKLKRYGKRWLTGETLPVSIGQGYLLMTPIQLASMISTVANEGTVYRPFLVKRIVDADGKMLKEQKPKVIGTLGVSRDHLRQIKQGLYAVVNDPGGTGANARLYDVRVSGKTGTSQVIKLGEDRKKSLPYQYRDHALFVAFAPYEKPEIAVAVVVEHGGGGGSVAAPVAARILRAFFDGKKPPGKGVRIDDDVENEDESEVSPKARKEDVDD